MATDDGRKTAGDTPRLSTSALAEEKARLKQAGKRQNSEDAYKSDLRHYEHAFGGALPATPTLVEDYLTQYSKTLNPSTLARRVASLSKYHRECGIPDPTKTDSIKALMRGIRSEHNAPPRQARPLDLATLVRLVEHWEAVIAAAAHHRDARVGRKLALQALRDRAFYLIGFWCGMRSDELVRLTVEHCNPVFKSGAELLSIFLPHTKSDREAKGTTWELPRLQVLCPVAAYHDWLRAAEHDAGAVFRSINKGGGIGPAGLNIDSVVKMMRASLTAAGMAEDDVNSYSSHSLRRGFATEFSERGGGLTALMAWVGWKDPANAAKYHDVAGSAPLELVTKWLEEQGVPARSPALTTPRLGSPREIPTESNKPHLLDLSDNVVAFPVAARPSAEPARAVPKKALLWRVKITLLGVRPAVWRRIDLNPAITLREFHDVLQAAMGWENFHLWEFHTECGRARYEGNPVLTDVCDPGDRLQYVYDMGDYWQHAVTIEKVEKVVAARAYPQCVAGANACPPEDCGGASGYVHMLRTLRGPRTVERSELIEQLGAPFNPKEFDVEEVNLRLTDLLDEV